MPKLLIAVSAAKPKDRKAATSSQNMKALIQKRVEKDPNDKEYTVVTINTKMKLANVVALINTPAKKLSKLEGVVVVENYTIDPEKSRGRWSVEPLKADVDGAKTVVDDNKDKKKGKKKKKKNKEGKE